MVAARHSDDRFVQTRADHELSYEHGVDDGHRMFGNKIEPPETHALALEDVRDVPFDSSRIVCGTSGPQKIERHGADEDHKSLPSRKGAEGVHHPDAQQWMKIAHEARKVPAPPSARVREAVGHGHGHASHQ